MDSVNRRGAIVRAVVVVSIGCVLVAVGAWWLRTPPGGIRSDDPAGSADASVEHSLAREAERAVRDGPRSAAEPLSPEGLRRIGEHWGSIAVASPPPGAKYEPVPIDREALAQIPRTVAGRPIDPTRSSRERPVEQLDPHLRFTSRANRSELR